MRREIHERILIMIFHCCTQLRIYVEEASALSVAHQLFKYSSNLANLPFRISYRPKNVVLFTRGAARNQQLNHLKKKKISGKDLAHCRFLGLKEETKIS